MDNAFEPGAEEEEEPLPLLYATQMTLVGFGALYWLLGLLGIVLLLMGIALAAEGSEDAFILIIEGPILLVTGGGFGSLMIATAGGLQRRAMWAWIATLVCGAMFLSSPCCLPIGAMWLYAMLQDRTRQVFLG